MVYTEFIDFINKIYYLDQLIKLSMNLLLRSINKVINEFIWYKDYYCIG